MDRPFADPNHPGNKIRPRVRCVGCGKLGCITYWGPWCFECNVKRIDRIDGQFAIVRAALEGEEE
jgi:hypothetical protein